MIPIGKIITALLTVLLAVTVLTNAQAASNADLEAEIETCRNVKNAAHQMADGARGLGFNDDHEIIQIAKERWAQADDWEQELTKQLEATKVFVWNGPVLTKRAGTVQGPSGKETYYNLPMQGVVNRMRRLGYDSENYPYWIRSDGAKMLGSYILCAASFDLRPIGTIVDTTRGKAIVADTGSFVISNPYQIDLAMQWG